MWKVGDRVLACRRPGVYWHPGTIRHVDGDRYYVIFDDGEDGFATAAELNEPRFEVGDQVFAYNPAAESYAPARILAVLAEGLLVRYGSGEEQTVPLSRLRVHPETWKERLPETEPEGPQWSLCDRVLACWFDLDWYPGIVLAAKPDLVHVLFDFGGQAIVPPNKLRPFELHPDEPVLCRPGGGPDFFTGRIGEVDGEKVHIHYDDGQEETTSVRLLRLRRDEWFPSKSAVPLAVGKRVLAQWYDRLWYPGLILSVDGRRVQVAFDDGDQALVTFDQVREVDIAVGSRVLCRWEGGPYYYPGEVTKQEGERIYVQYDDGRTEWTSIRMVRVER